MGVASPTVAAGTAEVDRKGSGSDKMESALLMKVALYLGGRLKCLFREKNLKNGN